MLSSASLVLFRFNLVPDESVLGKLPFNLHPRVYFLRGRHFGAIFRACYTVQGRIDRAHFGSIRNNTLFGVRRLVRLLLTGCCYIKAEVRCYVRLGRFRLG